MHVAIIMDGNGRWAAQRGLPRAAGHRAGARAVRQIVEAAARSQVETLTLYAFSSDNWARPPDEVDRLMRLFEWYLAAETARLVETGIRLVVIGRRDRINPRLAKTIARVESLTRGGTRLLLRLAVDYSSRAMLREAAAAPDEFERRLAALDIDLLIRTGGEQRLSDFMLWECAYAELVFVPTYWPDFDGSAFDAALAEFARRERRYGRLPDTAAASEVSC